MAIAARIAQMPVFGLTLTKMAINQAEDAMGMKQGIDAAFSLHQLAHAHNINLTGGSPMLGRPRRTFGRGCVAMLRDDPVAIVGVAVPRIGKHIADETATSLTLKSILAALDDAGVDKRDVNGMCATWPGPGGSPQAWSTNWARQLGVTLNWVIDEGLDVGGVRGVLNAAAAIKAGLCEIAVVATATAGGPPQSGRDRMAAIHHGGAQFVSGAAASDGRGDVADAALEFNHPYGGSGAIHRFALNAMRHMYDYGTTHEQIAEVAATIRNHGHVNPEAQMFGRGPYSDRGHPRLAMDRRAPPPPRVQPRRPVRRRRRADQRRARTRPAAAAGLRARRRHGDGRRPAPQPGPQPDERQPGWRADEGGVLAGGHHAR